MVIGMPIFVIALVCPLLCKQLPNRYTIEEVKMNILDLEIRDRNEDEIRQKEGRKQIDLEEEAYKVDFGANYGYFVEQFDLRHTKEAIVKFIIGKYMTYSLTSVILVYISNRPFMQIALLMIL